MTVYFSTPPQRLYQGGRPRREVDDPPCHLECRRLR
jgi:hypothetical protein